MNKRFLPVLGLFIGVFTILFLFEPGASTHGNGSAGKVTRGILFAGDSAPVLLAQADDPPDSETTPEPEAGDPADKVPTADETGPGAPPDSAPSPSSGAPDADAPAPAKPRTPPPATLADAVLEGTKEGARQTFADALKQLKDQVGGKISEYQKAIFDFEKKKKEMEKRIKKGLKTAEQVLNMAKAVKDLLYATPGYRAEVAREPLIWAAKKMLKAASPLQAVMFESEVDLIEDFLTMPKDRDPVDWIDRASTKMQVRLEEMVQNLNKPAEEMIVKHADQFFGLFGTSFDEVSKIYREQAEQSIARTMLELAKQEAVQEKLKDMAVNGKDWLKKKLKAAGNPDKYDGLIKKKSAKLEAAKAEITQIEAKIRNLTQKKKAVVANRRIHMGYVEKGRDVNAQLKQEQQKEKELEEQRQQLFETVNNFPAAQNAWVEASEAVENLEKQLGKMQTQSWAAKTKQELKQKENEQKKLQTELTKAKVKQVALRRKIDEARDAKNAADALEKEVRKVRARIEKLKDKAGSAMESSQDLEGENKNMDELIVQIAAAKDELKEALERRQKAADEWSAAQVKKTVAQEDAELYEKGRQVGSRIFGDIDLPPDKAAELIEKAEKGYEEAQRTIEYCKQKKEQFEGILQQAKQIAEVGKGFRQLAETFSARMEDINTIRKLISGGGVNLADLENAQISVANFITGSFGGMPQRCAAAMETIKGLDVTKLDSIFRDKISTSLSFIDPIDSSRLNQMKERLSTLGADFGKQLQSFEKFTGFVKKLQKKFDKLEELWGGEKMDKLIKKYSINEKYEEWINKPGKYIEKTVGKKNLAKIGKAAKFIAKFISKWDLDDPALTWVSPGPGELAYFHDKPITLSLIASDANSGINPNTDLWWFAVDGKRLLSDATLQRFKFQPKLFEEFYFLETKHREGVAQVILPPPGPSAARSEHALKGFVRDRAGHASNEVQQKFFLQYDPDPPEIKVLAPPSDRPAGKAGQSFAVKVTIADSISRVREKDVIFCISSAENPDKCWIYRGSDKSRVRFSAAQGSYSAAADASYQNTEVTFKTPEDLTDGLYVLTVRATNGAGMKNGVDHTFFIGDSYTDLVVTPNFSPAKISFTSSETFDLRFTATNFSFMEISDIEIKPHPILPAGAPLERIASAESIVIRRVAGKSGKDAQGDFRVGVRVSDGGERFRVGTVQENKRHDLKYNYRYKSEGASAEWKNRDLNVPVYLQADEGSKPTFVQGNLYFQTADNTGKVSGELPLPRGTQIRVSQIYKFPTFGGDMPKFVEQFIGYGQIRDNSGFFRVPVQLVGQSELRIRLVADALAVDDSQMDEKGKPVRKAIAAVAFPPGKIPYRCITEAFKIEEIAADSMAELEGEVRGQLVYQTGRKTLPYHHYGTGGKERARGITITWEGELSTGGFISPFGIRMQEGMFAASAFNAQANLLNPANPDMNGVIGNTPGLIWHNRTETLYLLSLSVKAYSFARSMIKVFERIPGFATDGTFIPILTSTFTPPPPPDPIIPEPSPDASVTVELPPLQIEPDEPPEIVDPKKPPRHLPKSLTLVAEAGASRVRALYTLNNGTHWEYAPDDPTFKPVAARFLPGNNVAILDAGQRRVLIVNPEGQVDAEAEFFTDADDAPRQLKDAAALAVVDGQSILIADSGNHRILELNQQLEMIWSWGGDSYDGSSPIRLPLAVERLMNGHTLVIDGAAKEVIEVTSAGTIVKRLGKAEGLTDPICLFRRAGENRFWVGETSGRITLFDEGGKAIRTIARVKTSQRGNDPFGGTGEEALSGLHALFADPDGNLLVARRSAGQISFLHRGESTWDTLKDLKEPSSVDMGMYTPPSDLPEEILALPPDKMVLVEPPDEEEITEEFDPWFEERRLREAETQRLEEEAQRKAASKQTDVRVTVALAERRPRPVMREPSRIVDITGTMIYYPFAPTLGDLSMPEPHYAAYQAGKGPRSHGIYVDRPNVMHDDLFFRAYGGMVRNKIFEVLDYPPSYKLEKRHSSTPMGLRDAWYQGWDHFFSFAVRNSATFPNLATADRKELRLLPLLEEYAGKVILQDDTGAYQWLDELKDKPGRGLNCEMAWALMMWKLFESYGDLFLTNLRSYALNAATPKYMPVSVMAELFADRLSDFLALGLVPVIRLETPDSSIPTLTNAAPRISWHANGILGEEADKQLKFTLLYADNIDFVNAHEIPIPEGKLLEFDFGTVLSEADQAAKLNNRLGNGIWYFRVRCDSEAFPNVGAKYGASSGIGAFRISLPTTTVTSAGGTVTFQGGAGVTGSVTVPSGGTDKPLQVSAQPLAIATGTNSDDVVGNAAIDFGPEGTKFNQVAEMNFKFDEKLLGGISPKALVVKRWDEKKNEWSPIRTAIDPAKQEVKAKSGGFSVYVLMIDKTPPMIKSLTDGPDPLGRFATHTSIITMETSENGLADIVILDPAGKPVRKLAEKLEFANNACRLLWDLTDDGGRRVPDGTYTCQASLTDFGGHTASPRHCLIHVSENPGYALAGQVTLQGRQTHDGVRVEALDTSVSVFSLASGVFRLSGLTTDPFELRFSRDGFFPETLLTTPGTMSASVSVDLRNLIVRDVKVEPLLLTPDADGLDDILSCFLNLDKPARLRAEVCDQNGKVVRRLLEPSSNSSGPVNLAWDGKNDRQDLVENGQYTLQVFAAIDDVELLQVRQVVRVDTGLAQEVFALPAVFSPNGDGIEDQSVITFRLVEPTVVSIKIVGQSEQPVKELFERSFCRPALYNEPWDGTDNNGQPLPDGAYRYVIETEYLDGTPSRPRQGKLLVDRVAPRITEVAPANGSRIATGLPELSAIILSSPGDVSTASIKVKIDEVTTDIDQYDPISGKVTFTPRTSLGEGVHIAIFYAYDLAGNAAPPGAVSFEVAFPKPKDADGKDLPFRDRHLPQVTDLDPADAKTVFSANPIISCRLFDADSGIDPQTISFWLNDEKVANQVTFYIPGRSGEDWDWWNYQRDVVLYNPLSGKVMFSPVKPLDEKTAWYSFSFEACDRQGNPVRSPTVKFKVVIDRKAPVIEGFEPADQAVLTSLQPKIRAQLRDSGGSGLFRGDIRLFFDGERVPAEEMEFDEGTGQMSWSPPSALDPDQQHIVSLIIHDRAGNRSAESFATFFVRPDTQAPILASSQPGPGQVVSAKTETLHLRWLDPGFSGLDEASARFHLNGQRLLPDNPDTPVIDGYQFKLEDLSGKRVGRVDIPLPGVLAMNQGAHQLTVSLADRSGNRSPVEVIDFRISDDTTPPVITALTPESTATVPPGAIRVSASFTDTGSGIDPSRLELALDGRQVEVSPEHLGGANQLSLTIMPERPLEKQSLHLLSLVVYDLAGNPSEPRVHVLRCD